MGTFTKKIDLRSDTVTKPSAEMRKAMFEAEVGDDVFGDDPSVNKLQELGASIFGKEAALYCSSGTLANQIAITVHAKPGDELICHEDAHIYRYEGGGIARNSGVSTKFLRGNSGLIKAEEIEDCINPDDIHFPVSQLICVEDTMNRGGGICYDLNELISIASVAKKNKLKFHLDGARVMNAIVAKEHDPKEYGSCFDTISICLSKGLGAPVGSLLLGSQAFISKARRVRKVFGGGMRQAGIIAAAGIYALKNNVTRLREDHENAREVAKCLEGKSWIKQIIEPQTNILVLELNEAFEVGDVVQKFEDHGILIVPFGKGRIRITTHLHFGKPELAEFKSRLTKF